MPNYGTVDLWQGFFDPKQTPTSQGQIVIGELAHMASMANDIYLAEHMIGSQWHLGNRDPDDPNVINDASTYWHSELARHCK